jgi:large subunit ribosomal protein L19
MRKIVEVEAPFLRKDRPDVRVGDRVNVGVVITETVEKKGKLEEKERVQVFQGDVIAKNGTGISQSITVRRIVAGEGVERVFPVHSPKVASIEVVRSTHVRRAKLYYLRERTGKATRLRERIGGREEGAAEGAAAAAPAAAAAAPAPQATA